MLASRSIAEAENITVSTLEVNNEYRRLSQLQDVYKRQDPGHGTMAG